MYQVHSCGHGRLKTQRQVILQIQLKLELGWSWHLFEDCLQPSRVSNLGPFLVRFFLRLHLWCKLEESEIFLYKSTLLIHKHLHLHVYILYMCAHEHWLPIKLQPPIEIGSMDIAIPKQKDMIVLFFFTFLKSREKGLSRCVWPTHFSEEKKLYITENNA